METMALLRTNCTIRDALAMLTLLEDVRIEGFFEVLPVELESPGPIRGCVVVNPKDFALASKTLDHWIPVSRFRTMLLA